MNFLNILLYVKFQIYLIMIILIIYNYLKNYCTINIYIKNIYSLFLLFVSFFIRVCIYVNMIIKNRYNIIY